MIKQEQLVQEDAKHVVAFEVALALVITYSSTAAPPFQLHTSSSFLRAFLLVFRGSVDHSPSRSAIKADPSEVAVLEHTILGLKCALLPPLAL